MTKRKVKSPIQKVDRKKPQPPKPKSIQAEEVVEHKEQKSTFKDYLNVFEFETELPGNGQIIKFRPLTVSHLKKLLTYDEVQGSAEDIEPDKITEIFDEIIETSVINEDFDIGELYLQDRFHLLLEIRKKTKGESEQYTIKCPKCGSQSVQVIDFDKIETTKKPEKINSFIKLTDDLSLTMKFITRSEEIEAYEFWRNLTDQNMNKLQRGNEASLFLEAQSIDSIITPNGEEDVTLIDKKYLLENIPQPLYAKIKKWSEDNDFGPKMEMDIKCPHCDYEAKQNITNLDFFS